MPTNELLMDDTTAIALMENSLETFRGAKEILIANQQRVTKAENFGNDLIALINSGGGMTAEFDVQCNNFLVKVKKTYDLTNDSRKPITQILDEIKKVFTALETKIDPKGKDNVYTKVVTLRNAFAKLVAEEQRKKEEAAQIQLKKDQERITLISEVEKKLADYFNDYLFQFKLKVTNAFEEITLENFTAKSDGLSKLKCSYAYEHFIAFKPTVTAIYNSDKEIGNIITNAVTGKFNGFASQYEKEITQLKSSLIARLPSKKTELDELAKAGEKKRLELEEQQKERQKQDQLRLAKEAEESKTKANQAIDTNKVTQETQALFNKEAAVVVDTPAPETRQGYEMTVTHQMGYMEIFAFWFEREGKNLPIDKLGKTSLDQMKSFCEKHAHKTNEKIESKFLKYEQTYKTVARRNG